MRRRLLPILALLAPLTVPVVLDPPRAEAAVADKVTLVGLTTANQLVSFSSSTPGTITTTTTVTGLQAGENLLALDSRPVDGLLYGLGSTSRLYTIDRTSGAAKVVGPGTPFSPALSGTEFGFDVNPVVDRVRVVSNTKQNLRLNPATGTGVATDTPLGFAAGDTSTGEPAVTAAAYTNSFVGTATTVLYGIDSTKDILTIVNPPNNGQLNTVGPLGVDVAEANGFDIDTTPSGAVGLAAFTVAGQTRLYSIDLTTGAATAQGAIGTGTTALRGLAVVAPIGYWLAGADGAVFNFGDADALGAANAKPLNKPVVGIAATPSGEGYWMAATDGGIFSFGDAKFFGSTGAITLNQPIVGIAGYPDGTGYWMVASDGGIFSFGSGTTSRFFGSTGDVKLNKPIVGMASTPSGLGYWLVASDGGIFSFGDAKFFGSTGDIKLNQPIVGMAPTPTGLGYWMVASDGGIFTFGDAKFLGSTGAIALNKPIVGMAPTASGAGYWLVASDGGIFTFGDAPSLGSTGDKTLPAPTVGMATT